MGTDQAAQAPGTQYSILIFPKSHAYARNVNGPAKDFFADLISIVLAEGMIRAGRKAPTFLRLAFALSQKHDDANNG